MKKVLLTLILSFALILSACANKSEDDNDHDSHSSAHAPKNAKQLKEKIFSHLIKTMLLSVKTK